MFYKERVAKVTTYLKEEGLDLLLIEEPMAIFYLTGLKLSLGKYYIGRDKRALFVDGRYLEMAKQHSFDPVYSLKEEEEQKFLDMIGKGAKVGFDSHFMKVAFFEKLKAFMKEDFILFPKERPLKKIRAIKEEKELVHLRKAADLTWKGLLHIKESLKEGISEIELSWEFEKYCRERGAEGLSFEPIIAFGPNSAMPHHRAGSAILKKDMVVLCDLGLKVDHYCADLTRVLFFGNRDPRIEKIYQIVKKAQRMAMDFCRNGVYIKDVDRIAREAISAEGYGENFVHRLGHGIGLEVHEYPSLPESDVQALLETNMVITLEPGIYLPGIGGVRYEDMVIIKDRGCECLYPE